MNYLYNGVELPALPDWDRDKYPYAVIFMGDSGSPSLYASSIPQYLTATDIGISQSFKEQGEMLSFYGFGGYIWEYSIRLSVSNGVYQNMVGGMKGIWANYDVYTPDGTLYLAASEPIPILAPTLDPLSMWLGWKAGNWVARQRGRKAEEEKTPVAFLYNGVRLPDINAVWTDKETYPYAVVLSMDGDTAMFTMPETMIITADGYIGVSADCTSLSYLLADGIWQSGEEIYITAEYGTMFSATCCIWASHDILNEDGTTYLAASEPVPVYE